MGVWTLGAWAGALAALGAGVGLGRLIDHPERAASLVVVAVALALTIVALGLGLAGASFRRTELVAAVWLALFARGLDHAAARPLELREGDRGKVAGMRDLEVVGASTPGGSCRLEVALAGSDVRATLTAPAERCPLGAGERLRVPVRSLRWFEGPARPGAPDPRALAASVGADAALDAREAWLAPRASGDGSDPWSRWVAGQRQRAFEHARADDGRALVVAAALGLRTALAAERRAELRAAGLGHLIAVSGLHVGVAAWLAFVILVRLAAGLGGALVVGVITALGMVFLYVAVTGAAASAVRAGTMAAIVAVGMLVGRPHHGLTTLLVACTLMCAVRPAWLFDVGFQLSAAAMAGIVGAPPGTSLLALTWRVNWAIAPVSLVHFGTVSAWGLVGNLVAIPVVSAWVLPLGLAGWLGSAWLGAVAWEPAAIGARLVLDVSAALSRLPPLSVSVIGAVAALAVCLRPWAGRLGVWPPLPFAFATLVAAVVVAWPPPAPDIAWVAEGSPRRFTLVVLGSAGGESYACVDAPFGSAQAQLGVLRGLDVSALGSVSPPGDPAAAALELAAVRAGWRTAMGECEAPEPKEIRAVLRWCGAFDPGRRAFAAMGTDGHRRCFVAGTWREG